MCTYSFIADKGIHDLTPLIPNHYPHQNPPLDDIRVADLEKKVKALEDALKAAKLYDDAFDQPDCELEEKKNALRDLAEKLGVEINLP